MIIINVYNPTCEKYGTTGIVFKGINNVQNKTQVMSVGLPFVNVVVEKLLLII